jgi:hypothetical protein
MMRMRAQVRQAAPVTTPAPAKYLLATKASVLDTCFILDGGLGITRAISILNADIQGKVGVA